MAKNKENKTSKTNVSSPATSSFTEVLSYVKVHPEVEALCDKVDGCILVNYIVDNREGVETLQNELSVALSKAPDAAKLVFKSLEGYDFSKSGWNHKGKMKLESLCTANNKSCIFLLESLFAIFGSYESGVVPSDVKDLVQELLRFEEKRCNLRRMRVFQSVGYIGLSGAPGHVWDGGDGGGLREG